MARLWKVSLVFLALHLLAGLESARAYDGATRIVGTGMDDIGLYVDFYINQFINAGEGTLYAYNNFGKTKIFTYNNKGSNRFQFYFTLYKSGARIVANNGDGGNASWSFCRPGQTLTKTDAGSTDAELIIRWYIPDDYTGYPLAFIGDGSSPSTIPGFPPIDINHFFPFPDNSSSKVFNKPSLPDPTISYSLSDIPGKIHIGYRYSGRVATYGQYDYTLKHWLDAPITILDTITEGGNGSGNTNLNGSFDYNKDQQDVSYVFRTRISGSRPEVYYDYSVPCKIPAYVWPSLLHAVYDKKDTVTLSWSVPAAGSDAFKGDDFEIERSTDPSFATNTVTVAQPPYKPDQTEYSVQDKITDIQGGEHLYYRLRRTASKDKWDWNVAVKTDLPVDLNTTAAADSAWLTYTSGTPTAIITWEPFRGVWVAGTKFSLRKSNKTTGAVAATIDLTEEQARSGKYVDKNIAYCNEFAYSIIITLGNGYSSPPEIQVPGYILAVKIGTITGLTASKGYFPDRTELQWHSQGNFDNYIIKRKIYGSSDNFIQIDNIPGSSTSDLQTDDAKGAPGVYYRYMVVGAVRCNDSIRYSRDTLYAVGFRAPTGNIYGRITYENGQAVENVTVRLQNNDGTRLGRSIYLNGNSNSYLKTDSLITPFTDSALTIEAWIRPDDAAPVNQVIFSREGQYELGFNASGQLYFSYNGAVVTGDYFNKNQAYVHLAGIHDGNSLTLMINDSVIATRAIAYSAAGNAGKIVYIGRNAAGYNFKGYLDEMVVWNTALKPARVARDYTLLLTGGEKGLAAYWRFDETITDHFYDISHHNEKYNRNDGVMDSLYVKHSDLIPGSYQLSLKAYTDSTGNYMIAGIPYTGQGTTYSIIPLFGTHQFDPVSVNRLVSAASSSFTVNFTDKSSFPVTGIVYYFNSTVPVPGVQFLIDGKYAQQSNGDLLQTGSDGKFSISVPVGTHEVRAVKNNHVFMAGGRIVDGHGHDRNYQAAAGPFTLYDSTTIRFIGRVAGGAVQEAYPLGYSLSTNNLGIQLKVVLQLPSGTKYDLYSGNKADSTVLVDHLLPSGQTGSSVIHKTRVVYDKLKDQIIIYPDSLTGEFEADLIPEKFIAVSVTATGWNELLDNGPVSLDFTNSFIPQYSVYSHKDSTQTVEGAWDYIQYTDSVVYQYAYKFIKRKTPTVSIVQLDNSKQELPYFGDTTYAYRSLGGEAQDIPVVDKSKTGRDQYIFGYPVFTQNKEYHFKVKAYEAYPYYKSDQDIAIRNGKPVIDEVPTADGHVSINNLIRDGVTQADTLSLDSTGTGYYDFVAGSPEIALPGTKDFSASVLFGGATTVVWNWFNEKKMQAFVMGAKLSGTDFVTAGPNKILMVLRDPPGNRSYSYVTSGSTTSSSSTYTGTFDQVGDVEAIAKVGAKIITWVGVGAGTINVVEATTKADVTLHHEEHYTGSNTTSNSTTFTSRFQTSNDPAFVGAPGDLYIGYSTNITYGQSSNLVIIQRKDLQSTDLVIYEASASSPYLVVNRSGINFGQKFGTLFVYPQQHIVKVLIPNLIHIRNNFLLPSSTSPAEAQQKADHDKTAVYVSKLAPDDPNFGKSNNDTTAFGVKAKTDPIGDGESYRIYFPASTRYRTDTIMMLNQYVHGWEQEIAHNEEEKINARSNLIQNFSFHAGSPVDYSKSESYSHNNTNSFNIILSASTLNSVNTTILGAGVEFKVKESVGTQQGGSFGDGSSTTTTMGFELASSGTDEYLTVDANKADDGGFAFRTKGGESGCPYEGVTTTRYYQPGTVLDQPTVQIEVPKIKVDNPVANNVPSTQKASYTLYLSNESEAHLPATFVLSYANTDSIQGAWIGVDGASLAGGRAFSVQYGQTVKKVLTITKGPNAMDYNNIPIILHSSCQYDPTGYQALIADTVLVSAHFVPSCSNINVKSPSGQWILNTLSQVNQDGKRYLPVTLDQFDESNSLFDHIALQYKPSANSQWITAMSFYGDSAKYKAAQGDKSFITDAAGINYDLVFDDASFNDQRYDIRALAVCRLGPGNYINTPSNVVSGIKDTYNPRLFGSPEPANGLLGIGDEIRLNFNETIAAGLLTPADFQVTGIRNGAQGDHAVSVDLDGQSDYLATEFDKNLTGKDITVEMWILQDKEENGTLFSQGNINESMELAVTKDNHLQVTIGKKKITSDKPFSYQPGNWAHVALVYHAADSTVSALYNFQAVIHNVSVPAYTGNGPFQFGRSISQQGNFFAGKMHEARIWSEDLSATQLQINSLTMFSGAEGGLLGYYPMTEGKGNLVHDKAHGNNALLTGTWSTPPGKALAFNGNGYFKMATGTAPVTAGMDYTIGLWFKAKPGQTDEALASNGKGDGTDPPPGSSKNLFFLGFEDGLLTFENNGFKMQAEGNYLDNHWHHVAVAVNRTSGTARLFADGVLKKYADARGLGGIAAAFTYLGARAWYDPADLVTPHFDRYFNGEIDEFRIWNTYLDQALLNKNSNIRLKGDELGLMVYYPFEKYKDVQGQKEMDSTTADQKIQEDPLVKIPPAMAVHAGISDDMAPVKDRGPVDNLNFDFVVNNDALIINLLEPKQAVDKTTLTFKVKDVRDMQGNAMVSPVTWTAFIDQNPLDWSDDALDLTKDVYKPMEFESYIVNSGGNNEHFTLDNLPPWLTADISSGSVLPKSRQKITFTVNEGLNVGTYDEIVYMRNDNGESQALSVKLRVKGLQPAWKVNPADFRYNMTIYGKIRIDHIFSDDPDDMLAAFSDGKCVGVTHNIYYKDLDLWYTFLTVYSDSLNLDNLEFRIWDAGTGKIYQGIPAVPVAFANDDIVGTSRDPVVFDGQEMLFENIALTGGWNWISFNLASPGLKKVNMALIKGSWQPGDIIKHELLGFDQYSQSAGWVGTLSGLDNTSLYKLNTGNAQTLSVSGTALDVRKTPIALKGHRWNYISYLPQVNMTVKEALAGYSPADQDVIKSQTGFAMYDSRGGWVGNLTYLEPGKGYMLYRTAGSDTSFVYPGISGVLRLKGNDVPGLGTARLNPLEMPVENNFNYADNMTVAATAGKEFALLPGDKIQAYAGADLRGEARAITNPLTGSPVFFFNISGKGNQLLHFEVKRNGKTVAQTGVVMSYMANSMIGTLREPFMLHFGKPEVQTGIYPNPFHDAVTIHVALLPGTHDIRMSVYDAGGKLVAAYPKETTDSKYYQVTWNGRNGNGLNCSAGMYFIHLFVDGASHVYKVVKY